MLILAGLPVANAFPRLLHGHLAAVQLLVVMLLLGWRSSRSPEPVGSAASSRPRIGIWQWGTLALLTSISVLYWQIGSGAEGSRLFDGHYYFGVARHIVETGRYEEPIVWHFLSPPEGLLHRPFDYWSGMTSIVLVPALWLFGDSYHVALVTLTTVAVFSLIAFWYLVTIASPLRHPLAQLIAILLFAFSPAVGGYRFDTETIPLAHLFLILALIAFSHCRYVAAVTFGFLMVLTRLDGMIAFIFISSACMARILLQSGDGRGRELRRVVSAVLLLVAVYVAYHLILFGTPTPPGAAAVSHLEYERDLFFFGEHNTSISQLSRILDPEYLTSGLRMVVERVRNQDLVPVQDLWLALALAAVLVARRATPLLAWSLLLAPFLIVQASRTVFSDRAILPLLPALVFAGGATLDELFLRLGSWKRRGRCVPLRSVAATLVVFASCYAFLVGVRPYTDAPRSELAEIFGLLESQLRGQPVATVIPYNVIAYTTSPAVSLPINGEAAIDEVLRRYAIQWLLLLERPVPRRLFNDEPSERLLVDIYRGERSRLGSFAFELAGTYSRGMRLFRVQRLAEASRLE